MGRAFRRWRRETKPRQAATRRSAQPRALLVLTSAVAALGADATADAAAATVATRGSVHPVRTSKEERGQAGALDPVGPDLCGREAAECADGAKCRGCLAMVMAWDWGKTAELLGLSGGSRWRGGGGGSGGGSGAGDSGDWLFEASPSATRCEEFGVAACRRFAAAAQEEEEKAAEESSASGWRRTESCMGNRKVQELLTCRVRAAGCVTDDAPCIMSESQRRWGLSLSAGEVTHSNIAIQASRPPSEHMERGRRAQAWPAAAAAAAAAVTAADVRANADAFDPEWAPRHQRRLATSSEATCNGIQGVNVCCSSDCGECGGSGCSTRGGGAEDCCRDNIEASGILCSDTGGAPPCIVDGKSRTTRLTWL